MCIDYHRTITLRKPRTVYKVVRVSRSGRFLSPMPVKNRDPQSGYDGPVGEVLQYTLRKKMTAPFLDTAGFYCFRRFKEADGWRYGRQYAVLVCSVPAGAQLRGSTDFDGKLAVSALTPLRVAKKGKS